MSPAEKVRNSFDMFQSYYNQLSKRIKEEQPEISERELRILLAKRHYGGDPKTLKLIAMAEDRLHIINTINEYVYNNHYRSSNSRSNRCF
jgi:hypothetical protein